MGEASPDATGDVAALVVDVEGLALALRRSGLTRTRVEIEAGLPRLSITKLLRTPQHDGRYWSFERWESLANVLDVPVSFITNARRFATSRNATGKRWAR